MNLRDEALIRLYYNTGARLSERDRELRRRRGRTGFEALFHALVGALRDRNVADPYAAAAMVLPAVGEEPETWT